MKKTLLLLMLFACGFLLAPVQAEDLTIQAKADAWIQELKALEAGQSFDQLKSRFLEFHKWLSGVKIADQSTTKDQDKAALMGAYNFGIDTAGRHGYYDFSAGLAREAYQRAKEIGASNAGLAEKASVFGTKTVARDKFVKNIGNAQDEWAKINQELIQLAEKKLKAMNELLAKTQVTPKELTKLKEDFKTINEEIKACEKKQSKARTNFEKISYDMQQAGIIIQPDMKKPIKEKSQAIADDEAKYQKIQKDVANDGEAWAKLVEKSGQSWKGLDKRLDKLTKLKKEIADLQKKLMDLLAQKPPTTKLMDRIKELNDKLDKLSAEYSKELQGLEDDFMNSQAFEALTPEQREKFNKRLSEFRAAKATFDEQNAKIDGLISEMEKELAKFVPPPAPIAPPSPDAPPPPVATPPVAPPPVASPPVVPPAPKPPVDILPPNPLTKLQELLKQYNELLAKLLELGKQIGEIDSRSAPPDKPNDENQGNPKDNQQNDTTGDKQSDDNTGSGDDNQKYQGGLGQ